MCLNLKIMILTTKFCPVMLYSMVLECSPTAEKAQLLSAVFPLLAQHQSKAGKEYLH